MDATSKDREESSLAIVTTLHEAYKVTEDATQLLQKGIAEDSSDIQVKPLNVYTVILIRIV